MREYVLKIWNNSTLNGDDINDDIVVIQPSESILLFRWKGMLIRNTLAVLDFNHNVDRPNKTKEDGTLMYKMKVRSFVYFQKLMHLKCFCFTILISKLCNIVFFNKVARCRTKATVIAVKVKKDYSYQDNIFDMCVDILSTGIALTPQVE